MNETDALKKHIQSWTLDVLNDQRKMDAWVQRSQAINRLNASGLLLDEEIQKISAEIEKDKLLDELLGVK